MTVETRALAALAALKAAEAALKKSCASSSLIEQFAAVLEQAEVELDLSDDDK
jgi:hypothetical protein